MKGHADELITITEDFHSALDLIEQSGKDSVFITGSAGTGKSTLLRLFRDSTDKRLVCLAPTGVAALLIGGQTIHSFFGLPPRLLQAGDFKTWKNRSIIRKLDMVIIDEISMVRADLMDAIDYYLRTVRKNELPFGGVKMVFFGDLYQLPPIVRGAAEMQYFNIEYESPYFFSSSVLQGECNLNVFQLQEVFRQKDKKLVSLLNRIRTNTIEYDDLELLNSRSDPGYNPPEYCVTLAARNRTVDGINKSRLNELEGGVQLYQAVVKGKFPPSAFPADSVLALKPGAQVIFLRNDPDGRFVNGTIGRVVELSDEYVLVEVVKGDENSIKIEVKPFKWDMLEYDFDAREKKLTTKSVGEFTQFPLRLAWALTIHKSQGKTFDRVVIDLRGGGAFETGQAYVALSRCKTLENIILRQPLNPQDIKIDPIVVDFFEYAV
ncbi:MAG: AAA family ATPase [Saprospirales bacterium]|nr:MAG: AAA family ATPase [Saprospirales bacterium]